MKAIPLSILLLISSLASAQIKLITPGEHLGYELETFDADGNPVATSISQAEAWTAVFTDGATFTTKAEQLSWDSTQNFTIQSDTTIQPTFYVQGIDNLAKSGQAALFGWDDFLSGNLLSWTLGSKQFCILHSNDPNCAALVDYQYGQIGGANALTLFSDVPQQQVNAIQLAAQNAVWLQWAGDLNGDGEPDFLLGLQSHHETSVIDLILSSNTNGNLTWTRVARFTEWM